MSLAIPPARRGSFGPIAVPQRCYRFDGYFVIGVGRPGMDSDGAAQAVACGEVAQKGIVDNDVTGAQPIGGMRELFGCGRCVLFAILC